MAVLVTGASGFLGGALTQELVQRGETVRILARETSNLKHLENLDIVIVYGTLETKSRLETALDGVQVVYHCAGASKDWATWEEFYNANVLGVQNLCEIAAASGTIQRFVHISTSDVYGYPKRACDETHPIRDIGLPYNRSKYLGEKIVWQFDQNTGLPVTIIRPVTIYGPRSKDFVVEIARLLLDSKMVLIAKGATPAGLLFIANAVDGIIAAASSPHTVGRAYNLRDETIETWRDYVWALADGLGVPRTRTNLPYSAAIALAYLFEGGFKLFRIKKRPLLTRHAVFFSSFDQSYAIERARRDFGFRSKIDFQTGIDQTIAWLKSAEGQSLILEN